MYSMKLVRRWGMVSSGATLTLPQLRARKVVFIPLLIPQPDWDKYHFLFPQAECWPLGREPKPPAQHLAPGHATARAVAQQHV